MMKPEIEIGDYWEHDIFKTVRILEIRKKGILCVNLSGEQRLACSHENGWENMLNRFLKKL